MTAVGLRGARAREALGLCVSGTAGPGVGVNWERLPTSTTKDSSSGRFLHQPKVYKCGGGSQIPRSALNITLHGPCRLTHEGAEP